MAHLAGAVVVFRAGVATAIAPSKTKQMATLHIHILRFCAVYFTCFCSPTPFPASRLRENITTAGLSRGPSLMAFCRDSKTKHFFWQKRAK